MAWAFPGSARADRWCMAATVDACRMANVSSCCLLLAVASAVPSATLQPQPVTHSSVGSHVWQVIFSHLFNWVFQASWTSPHLRYLCAVESIRPQRSLSVLSFLECGRQFPRFCDQSLVNISRAQVTNPFISSHAERLFHANRCDFFYFFVCIFCGIVFKGASQTRYSSVGSTQGYLPFLG
eukprot:7392005-Prymnesium_polylepis.3